jgi:plasmid stability protein
VEWYVPACSDSSLAGSTHPQAHRLTRASSAAAASSGVMSSPMAFCRADFLRGSVRVVTRFFRPVMPPRTLQYTNAQSHQLTVCWRYDSSAQHCSLQPSPAPDDTQSRLHVQAASHAQSVRAAVIATCTPASSKEGFPSQQCARGTKQTVSAAAPDTGRVRSHNSVHGAASPAVQGAELGGHVRELLRHRRQRGLLGGEHLGGRLPPPHPVLQRLYHGRLPPGRRRLSHGKGSTMY